MLGSHAQGVVPGIVEALRVAELTPLRSKYKKIQALHSALVLSFDPLNLLFVCPAALVFRRLLRVVTSVPWDRGRCGVRSRVPSRIPLVVGVGFDWSQPANLHGGGRHFGLGSLCL